MQSRNEKRRFFVNFGVKLTGNGHYPSFSIIHHINYSDYVKEHRPTSRKKPLSHRGLPQQKQIVKAAYDQEDWRRYGIMDKR